ncbi:MAG: hypothetical protein H3C62_02000 [Gemmatimonadaceae bacterium]|nr:hypothetical protein [Gemmatimonadaceae bacterium]
MATATSVYDKIEAALIGAERMLRAGLPPQRAGNVLIAACGDAVQDHVRFVVKHEKMLREVWPAAPLYRALLLSPASHPADVRDAALDLLETVHSMRGARAFQDLLPHRVGREQDTTAEIERALPGLVVAILLSARGIRPITMAERPHEHGTSHAAWIGESVRETMKIPSPSWWSRLTTSRDAQMARVQGIGGTLDARSAELLANARRRERAHDAPPIFETMQWIEAHLPGRSGVTSMSASHLRHARLVACDEAAQRVAGAEQRYARAIGSAGVGVSLHREGLGDVALATAYQRTLAHGDPFAVFDDVVATAGATHAQPVAFAIEAAATRRLHRLLTEEVIVNKTRHTVSVGSALDPRLQDRVLRAWHENTLRDEVELQRQRLGPRDPEAARVEEMAARLFEATLLLHAIAELRPVSAGTLSEPSRRWDQREIAAQVFIEQDPPSAPRTADGEVIPWQLMLQRHPAVGTPDAQTERSIAYASFPVSAPMSI